MEVAPGCHCGIFMGHSWTGRSQVGVKYHPALTTESAPCISSLPGFIRRDMGWRQDGLGKQSPEQGSATDPSSWVSKSHQLFPTPGRHPTLQGAARPVPWPLCLQLSLLHCRASPRCRHTAGPRLASPRDAHCPWAPEQAAHTAPVTHCQAGRMLWSACPGFFSGREG